MATRPYISKSIDELRRVFEGGCSSREILVELAAELENRKTKAARSLRQEVERALGAASVAIRQERRSDERAASSAPIPPESPGTDPASQSSADALLAAWTTMEVLTPQPLPDPEDLRAMRRKLVWLEMDSEPWNRPVNWRTGTEKSVYWFLYLGLLDIAAATRSLLKLFPDDQADERTDARGETALAVVVLDSHGRPVQDKTFVSSFAWGYGRVRAGALRELAGFASAEGALKSQIEARLIRYDDEGEILPISPEQIPGTTQWLMGELNVPPEEVNLSGAAVRVPQYSQGSEPPEPELLNSFFLEDLSRIRAALGKGDVGIALNRYLGVTRAPERTDIVRDPRAMRELCSPGRIPLARWPVRGRHPLFLMQQAAVNHTTTELRTAGIIGINGPPGTGKTTLLRDIVAKVVVDRAMALSTFDEPGSAFVQCGTMAFGARSIRLYLLHPSLLGHEIVVASSNNNAVENISRAIPSIEAIADDFEPPLRYFHSIADCIAHGDPNSEIPEGVAWGPAAAVLGNARNKNAFSNGFWWHKERGLGPYLKAVSEGWNPEGSPGQPVPEVLSLESAPQTPAEAQHRWREAQARFRAALQRSRDISTRLQQAHAALEAIDAARAEHSRATADLAEIKSKLAATERDLATCARSLASAENVVSGFASDRAALLAISPGFFARLFGTKRYKAWRTDVESLNHRLRHARNHVSDSMKACEAARDLLGALQVSAVNAEGREYLASAELKRLSSEIERGRAIAGPQFADADFWAQEDSRLQKSSPWLPKEFLTARDDLFAAAFYLHRAFIDVNAKFMRDNLGAAMTLLKGRALTSSQEPVRRSIWASLFLVVPVMSTTFASVTRLFGPLGREQLGWLLVDEAGQATPQAAAGAIWRASRVVSIGDPLQIEPVVSLSPRLVASIFSEFGVERDKWAAPDASVQALADRASHIGTLIKRVDGDIWVGSPLRVHRRCHEPMFSISNRIAYEGLMVFGTPPGSSVIGQVIGRSAWFSVDGDAEGKWSEAEGRVAADLLAQLLQSGLTDPDIFFITPFRIVANQLRQTIASDRRISGIWGSASRKWARERIGTVHTFQGKEAEAVVLVLGAPLPASAGARYWAGGAANLLNVAVTRAKHRLYVIGNPSSWKDAGVFSTLYRSLPIDELQ